jgi:Ca2+-binding RTX toxin-like protein
VALLLGLIIIVGTSNYASAQQLTNGDKINLPKPMGGSMRCVVNDKVTNSYPSSITFNAATENGKTTGSYELQGNFPAGIIFGNINFLQIKQNSEGGFNFSMVGTLPGPGVGCNPGLQFDPILITGFCSPEGAATGIDFISNGIDDRFTRGSFKGGPDDKVFCTPGGGFPAPDCKTKTGTNDDNNIVGTSGNDCIDGKRGDDKIAGLAGNDKLNGNDGKDLLVGSDGNDDLTGGQGPDSFSCGPGTDKITDFKPSEGDRKTSDCEQF